jgi:hypothetical protein
MEKPPAGSEFDITIERSNCLTQLRDPKDKLKVLVRIGEAWQREADIRDGPLSTMANVDLVQFEACPRCLLFDFDLGVDRHRVALR